MEQQFQQTPQSEPTGHLKPTEAWFTTTHWSVVLAAGGQKSAPAGGALETLCHSYWTPVYAYLRRHGQSYAEAQDTTQEFFAWLLQHEVIGAADRERGRFRSFLLGTLRHFLSAERERSMALKRGGGSITLSWEGLSPEQRHYLEPVDSFFNKYLKGEDDHLLENPAAAHPNIINFQKK